MNQQYRDVYMYMVYQFLCDIGAIPVDNCTTQFAIMKIGRLGETSRVTIFIDLFSLCCKIWDIFHQTERSTCIWRIETKINETYSVIGHLCAY